MYSHEISGADALTGLVEPDRRSFRVKGLIPRHDPYKASRWAIENLYNVVSEWPEDALLGITIAQHKGTVRVAGLVNEQAPDDWFDDLVYALAPVACVRRDSPARVLAAPTVEIVPIRRQVFSAEPLGLLMDEQPWRTVGHADAGRRAVPAHRNDPMWDFLAVLRTVPGAALRILISPASPIEREMSDAAWKSTFSGRAAVEWEMYRGTPIRSRVTLHFPDVVSRVPARLLAELKMMSQNLAFEPLSAAASRELRDPDARLLKGYALPKEAACAMWHLPAAGDLQPVPGMKVLTPAKRIVPYDAPAKPAIALRIGRCVNASGKHKPVWISPNDLGRHIRIVGSTGSGKSTAIRGLLREWIDSGHGCLLIDPSGALCPEVTGDVRDPDRVRYVDFSDTKSPTPFNFLRGEDTEFEARLQAFVQLVSDRDSEEYTGPRWRRSFGLAARACHQLFGDRCSLVAVFSVLGNQQLIQQLVAEVAPMDKSLADQLAKELGNVRGENATELWSWLAAKGEEILGSHALTRVVGAEANGVDLLQAMENSEVVLVNLGLSELGERSAQLLGCMLVAELRLAMLARSRRDVPFALVLDEGQLFQYGALPTVLDEARKYGVGVWVCHQRPDQLRFQLKDALSSNAGSYIQLRTGNPQDAAGASAMLNNWPINDLTRLRDLSGVAVISRDGVPSEPFSLELDFYKRHAEELADQELRSWRIDRARENANRARTSLASGRRPVTRENISDEMRRARAREETAEFSSRPPASGDLPAWLDVFGAAKS